MLEDIRWQTLGFKTYEVLNSKDLPIIILPGTSKKLIKVNWKNFTLPNLTILIGYIKGTVKTFNEESVVFEQKIFLGSNLLFLPNHIDFIENFYFIPLKSYQGTFTISIYEPTIQIIINPLTNTPVILGQDALNSIESINYNFSNTIVNQIKNYIDSQISTKLTIINNKLDSLSIQIQELNKSKKNV